MSIKKSIVKVITKPQISVIACKRGMTLLELVVYIALAALLLAPVVMLMHSSSLNMARDAKSLELRVSGRDVLNIMYGDMRNAGFKMNNFINFTTHPIAVYGGGDSSSFRHRLGGAFDTLDTRRGVLDNNGNWNFLEEVRYNVRENSTLVREIISRTDAGDTLVPPVPSEVRILAYNVEALKFEFSENLQFWQDGPVTLPAWRNDLNFTAAGVVPSNNTAATFDRKARVKYIKVTLVLKDNNQLSPVVNKNPDVIAGHTLPASGSAMREIHSIVIPVPNNGLFP